MYMKTIEDHNLDTRLKTDLEDLGLNIDFNFQFKGYSKSYYGRYLSKDKVIIVYILDRNNKMIPYNAILKTAIHEAIHHYQHHHSEDFVRYKGVMHNDEFKRLENHYYKLAELVDYDLELVVN